MTTSNLYRPTDNSQITLYIYLSVWALGLLTAAAFLFDWSLADMSANADQNLKQVQTAVRTEQNMKGVRKFITVGAQSTADYH